MKIERAYALDDLLLRPRYSRLESRSEVSLTGDREIFGRRLKLPIISAPMNTITEWQMYNALAFRGASGIIHRYMSVDEQIMQLHKAGSQLEASRSYAEAPVAVNTDWKRLERLVDAGAKNIVLDVAHGWSKKAVEFARNLRASFPHLYTVSGNITEPAALSEVSTDAVRVGIGNGSVCVTRQVSGAGVPLATVISDLHNFRKKSDIDIALIVDGGCKTTGDIVKCLALGADAVITGSMFAGAKECPDPSSYYGMASREAMEKRLDRDDDYEGSIHLRMPEGRKGEVREPGKYSVAQILEELEAGLQIGLSYIGARNIKELREKAKFVAVR